MKIYAFNNKIYTYKGYKFYIDDNTIIIEDPEGYSEYVEELPANLISNSEVRKAIYLAYTNFGDTYIDTILDILREQASDKTLSLIEDL